MLDLAAFTRLQLRDSELESNGRSCARVAERQTRWLQVPVSERAWGFKSPLAHAIKENPGLRTGVSFFALTACGWLVCGTVGLASTTEPPLPDGRRGWGFQQPFSYRVRLRSMASPLAPARRRPAGHSRPAGPAAELPDPVRLMVWLNDYLLTDYLLTATFGRAFASTGVSPSGRASAPSGELAGLRSFRK